MLLKVKNKYNTFLLSNTNELHKIEIDKQVQQEFNLEGIASYFKTSYLSYEMNLQKPEKEIFIQILEEQNLLPEETLFIDDTPKHIKTAKSLRIHTELATQTNDILKIFNEL